jgi:ATP synthase protein I
MAAVGPDGPRRRAASSALVNLGTMLFGCVVVGLGGGYLADRWLGSTPWMTLAGLGLGIAAAAVNFYRALRALNRIEDEDDST